MKEVGSCGEDATRHIDHAHAPSTSAFEVSGRRTDLYPCATLLYDGCTCSDITRDITETFHDVMSHREI